MVQHAGGRDHDVDLVAMAAGGLELPPAVDELAARDLVAEADAPLEVVVARDPLEVALDLRTGRELVAPVGVGAKEYE